MLGVHTARVTPIRACDRIKTKNGAHTGPILMIVVPDARPIELSLGHSPPRSLSGTR